MTKSRRIVCVGFAGFGAFLAGIVFPRNAAAEEINYAALVRAITEVESGGNPRAVGGNGERGLMQIKLDTWREVTARRFGERIPFTRAFEPQLNQQVGLAYLQQLAARLAAEKSKHKDDFLALLVAAYHRGPNHLKARGYSTRRMSAQARDYVQRVMNLHELYASEGKLLAMQTHSLGSAAAESLTAPN